MEWIEYLCLMPIFPLALWLMNVYAAVPVAAGRGVVARYAAHYSLASFGRADRPTGVMQFRLDDRSGRLAPDGAAGPLAPMKQNSAEVLRVLPGTDFQLQPKCGDAVTDEAWFGPLAV